MEIKNYSINIKDFFYKAYFLFFFSFLWILFGWNYDNADYHNYESIYEAIELNGSYPAVEPGFEALSKFFIYLDFNYDIFLIFYSLIGLFLIGSTIHKFTPNYNVVWFLYFIFPFMLDVVQIRNFMSMSIVVFSFRYLINDNKLNIFKFLICIIVASLFHTSSLFYILFLLVRFSIKKIVYICLVSSVFLQFLIRSNSELMSSFFYSNKLEHYLVGQTSTVGIFFFLVYLLFNLIIVVYIKKISINFDDLFYKKPIFEKILKINIIILVSYNLLIFDADFIRLQRNIMILNYIALSLILPYRKISVNYKTLMAIFTLFTVSLLSNWTFIIAQTYETVFKSIFTSNVVFKFLLGG